MKYIYYIKRINYLRDNSVIFFGKIKLKKIVCDLDVELNVYNSATMLSTNSVIEEISKLQSVKRMRASVNTAIKYGTMVGAITITSGILGGPVGFAVGGMISSCALGFMSQGELKSVPHILLYETTPEQREKLAKLLMQTCKIKTHNNSRLYI